jgi:hypothetical protein
MLMATQVFAVRARIVVENSAAPGVDTLLYNTLTTNLGYTVYYFDIDDIASAPGTYNSAYFDTAADVWVLAGSNVALPSPTASADSITNSHAGVVALAPDFWDETNLGIMDASDERSSEATGYLINVGQSHWITRGLVDTIACYAVTSKIFYNMLFPDSSHDIVPLIVDKDYKVDTSRVLMCAADSNTQVFNTGGKPSNVTLGRRVYFGLWQSLTTTADSCQMYSLFERAVSWAATDTLGEALKRLCWSGKYELDWVSVVESNGATSSYGNYNSNVGWDHNEKHMFCKVKNSSMQLKVGNVYRALDVLSAWFYLYYEGTSFTDYGTIAPTTWSEGFTLRPIIKKWQIERKNCFFSATCPNACFTYAWKDTAATPDVDYAWTGGGATDATDSRAINFDTLVVSESSPLNTRMTIYVQPDTLGGRMLDTLLNHGWASRLVHYENSNAGGDNGEMTFYAPIDNSNRTPRLNVILNTFSTSEPTPTIAIDAGAYDADSIVFTGILGQTIASQTVQVTNSAGGALECLSIADDAAWSTIIADETNTPMSFTMYIPFGQQAVGYRSGTVTVTCADATNSPKTFKIVSLITAATARQAKGAVEIR